MMLGDSRVPAVVQARPFERLPRDVQPRRYSLVLKPDLVDFTFEGREEIALEVSEGTLGVPFFFFFFYRATTRVLRSGDEMSLL